MQGAHTTNPQAIWESCSQVEWGLVEGKSLFSDWDSVFSVYFPIAQLSERIAEPGGEGVDDGFGESLGFQEFLIQAVYLTIDLKPPRELHGGDGECWFIATEAHVGFQRLPQR